jgi:mannose/cellobiose epimerase-like protein (N-acyl-D-glucosamine 2-epimerase family)
VQRARELFDAAWSLAWDGAWSLAWDGAWSLAWDGAWSLAWDGAWSLAWDDAYGGLVYGFAPNRSWCDTGKCFWVQAEAFATAALLHEATT